MRPLLIGVVVAMVFLALTFAIVSCEPGGDGHQDSPGIEVDIDAPKKHKPKPQYKAPKYGKRR